MSHRVKRPLSQLIYKRVQDNGASPRLLTLHDHNQFGQGVKDYALAASPDANILGLESYKGVFVGKEIVGYTWFVGPDERPSPLFFGDALAEIERFLWDEIDRQAPGDAELPFLLGVGQGAIMALATAAAVPDLISGIIAVGGTLPIVPGWEPPLAPLNGLPILILDNPMREPKDNVYSGNTLVETITAWGGKVQLSPHPGQDIPSEAMFTWLREHHPRIRSFSPQR